MAEKFPDTVTDAEKRAVSEVANAIAEARSKPKQSAFTFALTQISTEMIEEMLHPSHRNDDSLFTTAFMLFGLGARSLLYGDKKGRIEVEDGKIAEMVNEAGEYFFHEIVRRSGCFGVFELPSNPWSPNAAIKMDEPNIGKMDQLKKDLKSKGLPSPPYLDGNRYLLPKGAWI